MHVMADDLELYLLGRLTEDRASVIARHLKECGSCGALLDETRVFVRQLRELSQRHSVADAKERRRHPRIPTDDPAKLRVLRPVVLESENIQILDTSRDGLKLMTTRPIDSGALVQVWVRNLVVLAEVRHCQLVGAAYHVGVAIQETFSRSQ